MLLRKPTAPAAANLPLPAPPPLKEPQSKRVSWLRIFVLWFIIIALALLAIARWSAAQARVSQAEPQQLRTLPPVSLENCNLVKRLLNGEIPSSTEGLPAAGKPNEFGLVFWLKTPVLHATVDGKRVVLLKYNKYLPTQHDLKYSNTVSVLSQFGKHKSRLFPEMFAYCPDAGDGFHYILVEYLELHPSELAKPQSFNDCMSRAKRVMEMFVTLDEDMHLAFMDVKKGQWMARSSESFVLQDVDDMVRAPWIPTGQAGDLYHDQVDSAKEIMRSHLPKHTTQGQLDALWDREIFPRGYTIRYAMILLRFVLVDDLGFRWSQCGTPPVHNFRECLDNVLAWAATPNEDWPAPKQVLAALNECELHGTFSKTKREPASWRDIAPSSALLSAQKDKTYISCMRSYDSRKKTNANYTDGVQWCFDKTGNITAKTCCREKSKDQPCYYLAKQSLCN